MVAITRGESPDPRWFARLSAGGEWIRNFSSAILARGNKLAGADDSGRKPPACARPGTRPGVRLWVIPYERQGQKLDDFPNLKRWFEAIQARPAVVRAYELAKKINVQPTVSDESRSVLFGQTATTAAQ